MWLIWVWAAGKQTASAYTSQLNKKISLWKQVFGCGLCLIWDPLGSPYCLGVSFSRDSLISVETWVTQISKSMYLYFFLHISPRVRVLWNSSGILYSDKTFHLYDMVPYYSFSFHISDFRMMLSIFSEITKLQCFLFFFVFFHLRISFY